jgi:hypothetical protein
MPVRGAKGVVELPAGTLASRGVGTDDVVVFEQPQPLKSEPIGA